MNLDQQMNIYYKGPQQPGIFLTVKFLTTA